MIIEKQIDLGDYKITISVSSDTLHGHSLLTDYKENIDFYCLQMQSKIRDLISNHIRREVDND